MVRHCPLHEAAPELAKSLRQIIADWESVGDDVQVPDEINVNAHWDAARAAVEKAGS